MSDDKFCYRPLGDEEFLQKFVDCGTVCWREQAHRHISRFAPWLCLVLALCCVVLAWRLRLAHASQMPTRADQQQQSHQFGELQARCADLQSQVAALEQRVKQLTQQLLAAQAQRDIKNDVQPPESNDLRPAANMPQEISLYVPRGDDTMGVIYLFAPEAVPALTVAFAIKEHLFHTAKRVEPGWSRLQFTPPPNYRDKNDIRLLYTSPEGLEISYLPPAYRQSAVAGKMIGMRRETRDTIQRSTADAKVVQACLEYLQSIGK